MPDSLRRAIRTYVQGFVAILALLAVPVLNDIITSVGSGGEVVIDVPLWRSILIAAVSGGLISLIAFVQNWTEDHSNVPAPLKAPPSPGQNPAPDPEP